MRLPPSIALLVHWFEEGLIRLGRIKSRLNNDIISAIMTLKLKWFCPVLADVIQPVTDNNVDAIERVRVEIVVQILCESDSLD